MMKALNVIVHTNNFIAKTLRDPMIQQLYHDCNNMVHHLNFNSYFHQVEKIQKEIPICHLVNGGQLAISNTRINETAIRIQKNRSELVRLRLHCGLYAYRLNERIDSIQNYLTFKYQSNLMQEYRSREDRITAIDYILINPIHLWGRIRTVMDHIDLVIHDLDQAAWALSRIINTMTNINKNSEIL